MHREHIHGHFDFEIHIGGFTVANVTGNFSVTVAPAVPPPSPLTLTPTSGALPKETEGVPVPNDKMATVSGGVPPYNYAFSGLPNGVTAVEKDNGDGTFDIQLTGTPAAGDATGGDGAGNYAPSVVVTDSAPAVAAASAKVSVGR